MAAETILEKRVEMLVAFRKHKILEKEEQKEGTHLMVETPEKSKLVLWSIPASGAVGVRYIHQLKKTIDNKGLEGGIIISDGRYTQAAKSNARKNKIELIPLSSPAFNIFNHMLVPVHQILTAEEREQVLQKYKVQPYQLPQIKASDPIAKTIGAKPGDILRIVRDSATAGEYHSYRYVV
jgi:DNA-directed RNA polymerase subunit H (RpoH/RPB5)